MDTLIVILIATYLGISKDSAKIYQKEGWHIPDTTHLFTTSWNSHSAHALPVKVPTYKEVKKFPLFFGNYIKYSSPCNGQKTSGYGNRWGKNHYGIDLSGNTGDPVYSAFDGIVRYAQYNAGGYGNLIVIRHYNGLETYYAHLSKIEVKTDQKIHAGDEIGKMGNTGHSFGTHLHFEVRILGYPINPELIFDFVKQNILIKSYLINSNGIGLDASINNFCTNEVCIKKLSNKQVIHQENKDTIKQRERREIRFGNM